MPIFGNHHFDSDGDNSAQAARSVGGLLLGIEVSNPNSADAFIQIFDAVAADVTVGTTTPDLSFFVPANGAMDKDFASAPIQFHKAITYACTTTATGNGDPATGLVVNIIHA